MNDDDLRMPTPSVPPETLEAGEALSDGEALARQISGIAERSQHLVSEFLERQNGGNNVGMGDPLNIGAAFSR